MMIIPHNGNFSLKEQFIMKKKIVVLDGFTLNPGDLSWEKMKEFGDCTVYERTPQEQLIERAKDADILLVNKILLGKYEFEQLPNLKYVGVLATGYNVIDVKAAKAHGITVTNIPVYGTASVAQMVFSHLLNLTQHVAHHAETVKNGRWSGCADFCYWDYPLIELQGLTLGIVGCGRIGRQTAAMGRAFGMKTIGFDKFVDQVEGIEMVELDNLFKQSDVVSLHCPLTPENEKLINAESLALMKPSAYLINTSRGALIDEMALLEALNNKTIAGAGLDVLTVEPPKKDNPLLIAPNCYVTPHIAWATNSARKRLLDTAIENVNAFLSGKAQNVILK
jgi:glycerate dehydrogenase